MTAEGLSGKSLQDLLAQLSQRDEVARSGAASELIRRFEPVVRKFWRRQRCGDYADFVQDVMLRLFAALPNLRNAAAFPGFFRRIVSIAAADYWRRNPLESETADFHWESLALQSDQDITLPVVIGSLIDRLPATEAEVVRRSFLEDESSEEIALAMGMTAGAVRTAKSRAIKHLREILAREEEGDDAF